MSPHRPLVQLSSCCDREHRKMSTCQCLTYLLLFISLLMAAESVRMPSLVSGKLLSGRVGTDSEREVHMRLEPAAVMPGSTVGNAIIFQGIANGISIYNSVIIFRIALSWFPQLPRQFPFLRPVFTVTDPYLNFFRRQIPAIGGFDISAIPALFLLDIMSQTVVAVGAEIPDDIQKRLDDLKKKHDHALRKSDLWFYEIVFNQYQSLLPRNMERIWMKDEGWRMKKVISVVVLIYTINVQLQYLNVHVRAYVILESTSTFIPNDWSPFGESLVFGRKHKSSIISVDWHSRKNSTIVIQ